jgi:hypothetical protein
MTMELGEQVVFFTHESSDLTSRSIDELAFCTGIVDEHTINVVIFPVGGPVRFANVSDFGDLNAPVGSSYWRAKGSAAPDFKRYDEYQALLTKQRNDLSQSKPADRDKLLLDQKTERDAFVGKAEPAPTTGLAPIAPPVRKGATE